MRASPAVAWGRNRWSRPSPSSPSCSTHRRRWSVTLVTSGPVVSTSNLPDFTGGLSSWGPMLPARGPRRHRSCFVPGRDERRGGFGPLDVSPCPPGTGRRLRRSSTWNRTLGLSRGDELSGVLPPPSPAGLGQRGDGVVEGVLPLQGLGVVVFDPGAVVLRPVADALLPIVGVDLVDPSFAHERHVAHDARRGEPGEVPHDRTLELLGLPQGGPPVLAVRDHVAR